MISIHPGNLKGTIHAPSSKSISHRALILGTLGKPGTKIRNLLQSEDVEATKSALKNMGAEFIEDNEELAIKSGISSGSFRYTE